MNAKLAKNIEIETRTRAQFSKLLSPNLVEQLVAGKLHLDPEDLRLHVLAELATTAWSLSGRHWVRHSGQGGRKALLHRLDGAIKAIPASLDLAAPA